ncbi:uncharacterized protein N7477_003947 [Penicillium maclennaniae]|uniref:uncharacterized protein n=1 Tax=Penicillium maclennaniae TaxID=1343394 RepID=UPI00253F76FE|nr:uncharacterized protein N7477_003947 [Penicillium maclennaniae]KAJ5678314.1 hypothetical protein N7477_003947 [Penicillium maclennaniae]
MFKSTNPMMARLRLTTKAINGGYYKGNRTGSMGRFDKHGNYVIDYKKVRTYVVPEDLKDFKLTPFVTKRAEAKRSIYNKEIEQNGRTYTVVDKMTGRNYLELWAERNGEEVYERELIENPVEEIKTAEIPDKMPEEMPAKSH